MSVQVLSAELINKIRTFDTQNIVSRFNEHSNTDSGLTDIQYPQDISVITLTNWMFTANKNRDAHVTKFDRCFVQRAEPERTIYKTRILKDMESYRIVNKPPGSQTTCEKIQHATNNHS